jgi:hypothetical protein
MISHKSPDHCFGALSRGRLDRQNKMISPIADLVANFSFGGNPVHEIDSVAADLGLKVREQLNTF